MKRHCVKKVDILGQNQQVHGGVACPIHFPFHHEGMPEEKIPNSNEVINNKLQYDLKES